MAKKKWKAGIGNYGMNLIFLIGEEPWRNILNYMITLQMLLKGHYPPYESEVLKLAAVYDRGRHGHPPIPFYTYKLFFVCRLIGGSAAPSIETDAVDFFAEDCIPALSLTRVTPAQIRHMFDHHRYPEWPTSFD